MYNIVRSKERRPAGTGNKIRPTGTQNPDNRTKQKAEALKLTEGGRKPREIKQTAPTMTCQ